MISSVFSAHLDRPVRVLSVMCPRFLVAKREYPMIKTVSYEKFT